MGRSADLTMLQLKSPKGCLEAEICMSDTGVLSYTVRVEGATAVEPSEMGITVDGVFLGKDVLIGEASYIFIQDSYPARGGHKLAVNEYNEMTVAVNHSSSGVVWTLCARAYDDGFAYRYIVPGNSTRRVNGESSSWTLPEDSEVWFFERNNDWKLKSYAGEWLRTGVNLLPAISDQGTIQGTPLVFRMPGEGGYGVIMEAALYDYSGMRLEAVGGRKVKANFSEGKAGFEVEGTIISPWRAILLSPDLNGLVNSDFITNLNPTPSPELFPDLSYIRPGRSVWRWWSLGTGTPEEEQHMIDCARLLDFEYTTIDEGWEQWPNPWSSLLELTTYANLHHIGVFVWKRSKEINDPKDNWAQMRVFFDKVKTAGCVGMKIDFIDSEDKASIDFEISALRLAAERRMMINFHGISKPTGESRTYPNEISREGIRGLELNKMSEGPIPAFHNAALPFTRFIAGHGDYTPVGFTNPGGTTWAHQLATVVVFTSPLQVIAENPDFLLNDIRVRPALGMLKEIPTVWDETRVLAPSTIAELAAFARRSGDVWFVALLNGTEEKKTIEQLDLSFLGEGSYEGVFISSQETASLERKDIVLKPEERSLRVEFLPADGFVAILKPL